LSPRSSTTSATAWLPLAHFAAAVEEVFTGEPSFR
jgi:hypothetical protein